MKTDDLIRALKGVPEFHPRLIQLAWELVLEDGTINHEKVAFYSQELEEAIAEAKDYSQATKEAVRCLKEMVRS